MSPELSTIYDELKGHWPKNLNMDINNYLTALRVKDNWFWEELLLLWWGYCRECLIEYENHMTEFPKSYFFCSEWEGQKAEELEKALRQAWHFRPRLKLKGEKV